MENSGANKRIILEKLYYAKETKHNKNKRRYYNQKELFIM